MLKLIALDIKNGGFLGPNSGLDEQMVASAITDAKPLMGHDKAA